MSFSKRVKEEVYNINTEARHCNLALLSAILNLSCQIEYTKDIGNITFSSDNMKIYNLAKDLIYELFKIIIEEDLNNNAFVIKEKEIVYDILSSTYLIESRNINKFFLKRNCCKKQFIKGVFLLCGSVSDPEKTYHLEFVFRDEGFAMDFSELINSFKINSKVISRKKYFIVYVKDSDKISDFLKIIFASNSLMLFENIRIMKDVRNNTNRVVNCEAENIKKTVSAANFHIENILLIKNNKSMNILSMDLQKIANLRLKNDHSSLKELGELSEPKLSKASVNYKLKKISKIADDIRGGII